MNDPVLKNKDPLFYFVLVLAILFQIFHGLVLPIMISWDGYLYVQLADILGTSQFSSKWDFLRTPLFPLALKMSFFIGGKNPLSVIVLNTVFGMTGTLLIVSVIKQSWGQFSAIVALLLLSFYPALIVYEHCLLSEVSTFFCLAIIIKLLSDNRPQHHYFMKSLFLILGLTIGYYFRPTLLYLSPLVGLLFGFSLWKTGAHPENMKRDSSGRTALSSL
jgi:4-amino-4-deoxy-L-arabinose transferase-like glycosyltransferase